MEIKNLKSINFKQPKYILPAIIYIPLLFIGYFVIDVFGFEKAEKSDPTLETTEYLNPNLPQANVDKQLKGKYNSMYDVYGHISDLTAVDNVSRDTDVVAKEDYESKYSEEEIEALEEEQARKLAEMEALLTESQNSALTERNVQSNSMREDVQQEAIDAQNQADLEELKRTLQAYQQGSGQNSNKDVPSSVVLASNEATTTPSAQVQQTNEDEQAQVVKKVKVSSDYFNTISSGQQESNLIQAIIDEEVKATDGSRLRLRLLDDVVINESIIKKGTYLYAQMSGFSSQRAKGSIKSILLDDKIIKVNLSIYDMDGLEGLYIPKSNFREAVKDVGTSALSNTSMLTNGMGYENSLSQWRNMALMNATQRASSALSRNVRRNSATVKYGTHVYLINGK